MYPKCICGRGSIPESRWGGYNASVAVQALLSKTGGAMLQSPCGLLGCPRLLLSRPVNLWNFQTWKFHHNVHCKQISDSQAFRPTKTK